VTDRRRVRISHLRAVRLPAAAGLCAVLALAAGSVAAAGEGGQPTAAANRASAGQDVRGLLRVIRLPPESVALDSAPAGGAAIDNRFPGPGSVNLVDAHAWWRVQGTPAALISFEREHPPPGSRLSSSGGGTTTVPRARSSSDYVTLTFGFAPRPGVLDSRAVTVKATAIAAGSTAVRLDAEDVWEIPRSAGERVPSGAREIDVASGTSGRPPTFSISVTDAARVRTIVSWIDRLPVVQPGVLGCPMLPARGPVATFTFRAAGGAVLARASQPVVSGPTTACDPMGFTIRGRRQTPLLGGTGFLAEVGRLLGHTLAARR